MIPFLLILIPLIGGLVCFSAKNQLTPRSWALTVSLVTLGIICLVWGFTDRSYELSSNFSWLPYIGARLDLQMDGISKLLCLLNALAFPIIFLSTYKTQYKNASAFYALMLLTQAGMFGVFLAQDALLFYFFWELALIPVYFLCSLWGGGNCRRITFKFFVYTFTGSLLMLIGIIYLYLHNPDSSFALSSLLKVKLSGTEQKWMFWLFFLAFAVKMPLFPLHSWQADTYETAPNAVTMVLSAVMAKMGVYAMIRFLLPLFPQASSFYANLILVFCIIGMLYGALIAIRSSNIKRLIAFASLGHLSLMGAAIFTMSKIGLEGVTFQMFMHGITVLGLWIMADFLEKETHTRDLHQMGGLAQKIPVITLFTVIFTLANLALPLTGNFIAEFLMFNSLFHQGILFAVFGGLSIILVAVYSLNMIQKIFYGTLGDTIGKVSDAKGWLLGVSVVMILIILFLGIYPQPFLDSIKGSVSAILR